MKSRALFLASDRMFCNDQYVKDMKWSSIISLFRETLGTLIQSSWVRLFLVIVIVMQISSWVGHRSDKALQEDLKWEKQPDRLPDLVDMAIQANNQEAKIEQIMRKEDKFFQPETDFSKNNILPQLDRPPKKHDWMSSVFSASVNCPSFGKENPQALLIETFKGVIYLAKAVEYLFEKKERE